MHKKKRERQTKLESVQRRATKLIPDLKHLEYTERLSRLNLPTLFYRRARGDMIECYKYLTGIYNVAGELLPRDQESTTRGHTYKLKKPSVKTSLRQNFFSVRVVNAWNSLPEGVVAAPSLNSFKNRLDRAWAHYKYTMDSKWYKAPKSNQTGTDETCENNQEEVTRDDSSRSADRLVA